MMITIIDNLITSTIFLPAEKKVQRLTIPFKYIIEKNYIATLYNATKISQ